MRRVILFVAALAVGCSRATTPPVTVSAKASLAPIHKLAVMPVGASAATTGSAAARAPAAVSEMLLKAASREAVWTTVDPDAVGAALDAIKTTDSTVVKAGELAARLGADATLTATVARYEERQGGDYGVSEPASVSIQVLVVGAGQKQPEWKADYAITQEPLAYNLWNFWGFVRGGAKWLTVNELARIGIEEAVRRLAQRSGAS
jgi:hypothetical protein